MTQHTNLYLMWLRQDLRLLDNTALNACFEQAASQNAPIIAIYYLTPVQWQHHNTSLWQIDLILRQLIWLKAALTQLNIGLVIRTVADFTAQVDDLLAFCHTYGIYHVFANREYLVNEAQRDADFIKRAGLQQIHSYWFDDRYLIPPKSIINQSGNAYKVFTPFYKRWLSMLETIGVTLSENPTSQSVNTVAFATSLTQNNQILDITVFYQQYYKGGLNISNSADSMSASVDDSHLLELIAQTGEQRYPAGEKAAYTRLTDFLAEDVKQYTVARDVPAYHDIDGSTSHLSAYLTLGIISPRFCYLQAMNSFNQDYNASQFYHADRLSWIRQLAWRDFYGNIVVNYPNIVKGEAFLSKLDMAVEWRYDIADFASWCQGKTGVPLVDAAMRCLNETGFMHNRLRMVVAMYLTKNLLIDWRWGERYFMQHLVDGDFANNNGGWQWSASVGTDAQPYFRVMNPFSQAANYDNEAKFIKHWLPCLSKIPFSILHSESKLQAYLKANPLVNYPLLTLATKISRADAIATFKMAKSNGLE